MKTYWKTVGVVVVALAAFPAWAQISVDPTMASGAPSEAEAKAAFEQARSRFRVTDVSGTLLPAVDDPLVVLSSGPQPRSFDLEGSPANLGLEHVRLVINVDNMALEDVFAKIVAQAARYTGPWTVKWRLKPENVDLMDQRVNLTAEAPFGEFVDLLTERIRNMSGVELYVTAFRSARVIMISDTYN